MAPFVWASARIIIARSSRILYPWLGWTICVFGCWDIFEDNCYEAALHAGVIEPTRLEAVRPELEAIQPWKAVFDQRYVRRLLGPHVKTGQNKHDLAMQLMEDIEMFAASTRSRAHGDAVVREHGSPDGTG